MRRFKVKDLMIDVVSADVDRDTAELQAMRHCWILKSCHHILSDACKLWVSYCALPSYDACALIGTNWCTPIMSGLVGCKGISELDIDTDRLVFDFDELIVIREHTEAVLGRVAEAAEIAAMQMTPKTVKEVESLEAQLNEALSELASLKKNMKK